MTAKQTFVTALETYTVVKQIGCGGAGKVYEVTSSDGTTFALKHMDGLNGSTQRGKRARNEMSFLLRATHPNIVRLEDYGVTLKGSKSEPFYVMKRYSGTLRDYMQSADPEGLLVAFSQVLDGCEAAHIQGVFHRDLKPENILWDRGTHSFAVADFGIAHFNEDALYTTVETRTGERLANFGYAAPEQKRRGESVDARTDIFALGLILNELFTGLRPEGAGPKRIGDAIATLGYLDALVERMIQQNPGSRPSSINEIKLELIGRRHEFVRQQELNHMRKQVVPAHLPPDFAPIELASVDFVGGYLIFLLNRVPPRGWEHEFKKQRGGHDSIFLFGPERFQLERGALQISAPMADAKFAQQLADHVKRYINRANENYAEQLRSAAKQREIDAREALARKISEAERRLGIVSGVRV